MKKQYYEAALRRVLVRLHVRGGSGGCVVGGSGGFVRMEVGLEGEWAAVVGRLVHESMELAASELKLRFEPSDFYARSTVDYLFVMSHQEFSDACDWAGDFISKVLLWLREQWETRNQEREEGDS